MSQTETAANAAANENAAECYQHPTAPETAEQRPEASLCNPDDTTSDAASPVYPILLRETPGGRRARPATTDVDALLRAWDCDAHIVQYEGGVRRNKVDVSPDSPLVLSLELYDFDRKSMPDEDRAAWSEACLSKLPDGFIGYRTAGGFRALTLRERPFIVLDAESWEDWRQYHGGRAEALGKLIGAEPDHATDEPNRLFRLPNVQRDDGKPSYPKLYGTIGYATLAPAPWERKPATEVFAGGSAQHTKAGAVFSAAGLVQRVDGQKLVVTCPWAHEHSGRNTSGTFIDDDADHLGHFVCMHEHCRHRTTDDAIEALQGLPAVEAELRHWPDPSNILMPYERVDEVPTAPEPAAMQTAAQQAAPWIDFDDLLKISAEPVDWLCKELGFCPGRPGAVVASPNAGKTWALSSIALAVAGADALKIFDRFDCRHGPVLHVSTDAGEYATSDRYRKLSRSMGRPVHPIRVWPGRVKCVNARGQFDASQPGWRAIVAEVERAEAAGAPYALVIFDSLFAVAAGVEMNSPEAAEPLWATRGWGSTTVIWAMHTPKKRTEAGAAAYGSVAIEAACGSMWSMGLVDEDRDKPRAWGQLRRAEEADGDTIKQFHTEWKDKERIAFWEPPADGGEDRELLLHRIRNDILRELKNSPNGGPGCGGTQRQPVLDLIEGPETMIEAMFDMLVKQRVIERGPKDRGGSKKSAARYRIADGVTVSDHAHEPVMVAGVVVPVEDPRPVSKRPEYRRALRATGRAA